MCANGGGEDWRWVGWWFFFFSLNKCIICLYYYKYYMENTIVFWQGCPYRNWLLVVCKIGTCSFTWDTHHIACFYLWCNDAYCQMSLDIKYPLKCISYSPWYCNSVSPVFIASYFCPYNMPIACLILWLSLQICISLFLKGLCRRENATRLVYFYQSSCSKISNSQAKTCLQGLPKCICRSVHIKIESFPPFPPAPTNFGL